MNGNNLSRKKSARKTGNGLESVDFYGWTKVIISLKAFFCSGAKAE